MPALRVCDGNPAQHVREVAILARPEQEIPVIGHQAISRDAYRGAVVRFRKNPLKGGIVCSFVKERKSADPTVQDVIGEVPSSKARSTRHGDLLSNLS